MKIESASQFVQHNLNVFHESIHIFQSELSTLSDKELSHLGINRADISDFHTLPACRKILHCIDDESLSKYKIQRTVGYIFLTDTSIKPLGIHSYFTLIDHPTIIIDVLAGQFAKHVYTSYDSWITTYPELFCENILIGDKTDIAHKLKIKYPETNTCFDTVFSHNAEFLLRVAQHVVD